MRNGYIDTSSRKTIKQSCEAYLQQRTSCYEFRSIRYGAVYEQMKNMGLKKSDSVMDIGAGDCEFERYLREQNHFGDYVPIDGLIDGTDLNLWTPKHSANFLVAIEVIEHLLNPFRMLSVMEMFATKGAIVTTPNPSVVDVYSMDETHISEMTASDFCSLGWKVVPQIFFAEYEDSLLAWKSNHQQTLGI